MLSNRRTRSSANRRGVEEALLWQEQRTDGAGVIWLLQRAGTGSAPAISTKVKEKKEPGHGRAHFPANLPREVIDLDLLEEERVCDFCGKPVKLIGEDITERGHRIPAQIVVKQCG
jgi:hypothetical protein